MPGGPRVCFQGILNFCLGWPPFFLRTRCATLSSSALEPQQDGVLPYLFGDCVLDTDRRELRRGTALVAVEPQVFDLLAHLVRNRDRVVSKDELLAAIWHGRIVSESALFNRINAARSAIGDTGGKQRLIKTLPRKGLRFIAEVREDRAASSHRTPPASPSLPLPDRPSIAVLPFTNMTPLKARALIRGADLDPQMRKVVVAAFENAWEEVAPQASPEVIVAARMTLAEIILQLVGNGTRDLQVLTDAAVRAMLNLPTR